MTYNEWLEYEVKQLERDKRYWLDNFKRLRDDKIKLIDENEEHKQRISNLVHTNTRLKDEKTILNHKLSIQLERNTQLKIQRDDEINQLKQELFNAYLEIESDNVNIQLSHYHIKKLLKIIDEHTLINPYTD